MITYLILGIWLVCSILVVSLSFIVCEKDTPYILILLVGILGPIVLIFAIAQDIYNRLKHKFYNPER
jgi:hypothetical protein